MSMQGHIAQLQHCVAIHGGADDADALKAVLTERTALLARVDEYQRALTLCGRTLRKLTEEVIAAAPTASPAKSDPIPVDVSAMPNVQPGRDFDTNKSASQGAKVVGYLLPCEVAALKNGTHRVTISRDSLFFADKAVIWKSDYDALQADMTDAEEVIYNSTQQICVLSEELEKAERERDAYKTVIAEFGCGYYSGDDIREKFTNRVAEILGEGK